MKKGNLISAVLAAILAFGSVGAEVTLTDVSVFAASSAKLAAPENFYAKSVTYSSITLKWDAVDGADAYFVYRYNPDTKKYKKIKTVTKTKCKVSELSEQTKYTFRVAAAVKGKNGKYKVQTKSEKLTVTTEKNPALDVAAPENFKTTAKSTEYVIVTWSAADGADAYKVELYDSASDTYQKVKIVKKCKCKITGLEAGTEYKIRVTSLVKIDEKYKATNSGTARISTESETAALPDGSAVEPGIWSNPTFGDDISTTLKMTNLGYYSSELKSDGSTEIIGTAYIFNYSDDVALLVFNVLGQLCEYAVLYDCSYSDYSSLVTDLYSGGEYSNVDGYDCFTYSDGVITLKYDSGSLYMNVKSFIYAPATA